MKVKKILALTLAMVMVLSSISVMNIFADDAQAVNYAWIEGESGTANDSKLLTSAQKNLTLEWASNKSVYGINGTTAAPASDDYHVDYTINVAKTQEYDIFVYTSDITYSSSWASPVVLKVNGEEKEKTKVTNGVWPGWGSSTSFPSGWMKVTATLSSDTSNTFTWLINTPRSDENYHGIIDAIVVLPKDSGFTPVNPTVGSTLAGGSFAASNVVNYQLCTLLTEYDLNNITEDITLPATTPDGTAVTWTTSDDTVITENGVVAETTETKTATLTAAVTVDDAPYTKDFAITVVPKTVASAVNSAWIEGENGSPDGGTNNRFYTFATTDDRHNTLSAKQAFYASNTAVTNIGIDYTFDVETSQSYDIFVRGTYLEDSDDAPDISMYIDNVQCNSLQRLNSMSIIRNSSNTGWNYSVSWVKISSKLEAGTHTFKYKMGEPGANMGGKNKAIMDLVVVLPTAVGFEPTYIREGSEAFPIKNSIDYDLCTLLTAYDLTSLKEDITLANTTPAGNGVSWETSDSSVIALDGTVTRSEDATKTVTLTASTTVDGVDYSKVFTVTVPKLGDYIVDSFAITQADGSAIDALSEGLAIKASAEVTSAKAGTVKIILAHYRADKSIVDFSIEPCTLTAEVPGDALAEYTVTDYEDGDFVKAFIWSDFETLVPITASISK